jgi:outer membrane protein OmpA-like peptidoglycan-associated protein
MSSRFVYFIAVIGGLSVAQSRAADDAAAYLVSGPERTPVSLAHGGCVRTSQWTPDSSHGPCEPLPFRVAMDALFDFDSAVLTIDAERALDALTQHIAEAEYQKVEIVGRADRIGRADYNRKLSEQRAEAVRDYLIAQGMDRSKIAISGLGSVESATRTLCESFHGEALVQCLQPDRSAEVTVIGKEAAAVVGKRLSTDLVIAR